MHVFAIKIHGRTSWSISNHFVRGTEADCQSCFQLLYSCVEFDLCAVTSKQFVTNKTCVKQLHLDALNQTLNVAVRWLSCNRLIIANRQIFYLNQTYRISRLDAFTSRNASSQMTPLPRTLWEKNAFFTEDAPGLKNLVVQPNPT